MNDLLEEQLRETYAQRNAGYDPRAAAERLTTQSYPTSWPWRSGGARFRPQARLVLLGGVAAVALAVALVLVVATRRTASLRGLSDRAVIARAAAFVTGSGSGVLHVDSTTTTLATGRRKGSYSVDRWSEENPPYDYWIAATLGQETRAGNTITTYRADWNQITIGNAVHGPVPGQIVDPLEQAIIMVGSNHNGITLRGRSFDSPRLFAQELTLVLNTPGVTVDRSATFRGAPAIRITSADKHGTLYVNPGTYRPLAFLAIWRVLGKDNKVVETVHTTTVFSAYETLPARSTKMPDLVLQHPHAKVPTWDRRYWREYWKRRSSGTITTRRQALAELNN